ncbi:hypothetical protein IFR05_012978 [Cadophora sp. M221]|nr:hypothetical protein IFR05_012978 [Cadophora sp. M221]
MATLSLTPVVTGRTAKPYRCSFCPKTFTRTEHLKRHHMLHTGEKNFQCRLFSRVTSSSYRHSDVLVRHLKGCNQTALHLNDKPAKPPTKRPRVKRACDRCAQVKSKCDYQMPCSRCCGKQLPCQYTRETDPQLRLIYSVENEVSQSPDDDAETTNAPPPSGIGQEVASDGSLPEEIIGDNTRGSAATILPLSNSQPPPLDAFNMVDELDLSLAWNEWSNIGPNGNLSYPPPPVGQWGEMDSIDPSMSNFDMDASSWRSSMVPRLGFWYGSSLSSPSPVCTAGEMKIPVRGGDGDSGLLTLGSTKATHSFSLVQIDPLEAQSASLRELLKGPGPSIPEEVISSSVTRANLFIALRLYGEHFQPNHPILHAPTFDLANTPPLLLLAMFCIGSCYSRDIVPNKDIFKFAMHVFTSIEHQPQEIYMQEPPLYTLQACLCACQLLACSNNQTSFKIVPIYLARIISMAQRAHLFDAVEFVDYSAMNGLDFDWLRWADREMRNRIACALFNQSVGACLFQGSTPVISPLDLDVDLPCYEICWEAKSAAECLQHLKSNPSQLRVSTAIQNHLTGLSLENNTAFETSAFGMFTLIHGLHCLLWRTIHYSIDDNSKPSSKHGTGEYPHQRIDVSKSLEASFNGPAISALASEIVAADGSNALRRVNQALENWMRTWELRNFRDGYYDEKAFVLDPVPFYWLAKLFLVIHCSGSGIPEDSEFTKLRPRDSEIGKRMRVQGNVFAWLTKLRRRERKVNSEPEGSLAGLLQPLG